MCIKAWLNQNSVGLDFEEKYSSHLCETWQEGSFPRLHPFESRDSHLPCNGQNVSLKIGILSQTLFVLFCRFSMAPAPSKDFRILPCNHVHALSAYVACDSGLTPVQCFLDHCFKRKYRCKPVSIYDFLERQDREILRKVFKSSTLTYNASCQTV